MYPTPYQDLMKSFDSEITRLEYVPDQELLIAASKSKQIKVWSMPKEWRDAMIVANEKKEADKYIATVNKTKLAERINKAKEDSDEDDLVGWHLDW